MRSLWNDSHFFQGKANFAADVFAALWMTNLISLPDSSFFTRFLLLACCSILNIAVLFIVYGNCSEGDIIYADR